MNRKNINDVIKVLLPLSSTVIGPPRSNADTPGYIEAHPENGRIAFYDKAGFTTAHLILPDFFQSHQLVPNHTSFVACLHRARVWGRNGAVIAAGDCLLTDVSREFTKGLNVEHSIHSVLRQVKARKLVGDIAVIGTAGANVYYHWMLDILPRLGLISKQVTLESVSYFITEFTNLPYQAETLKKAGISADKIIASNENWKFHIKADTLWLPALMGPIDQPTRQQVSYLKSLYKDEVSTGTPHKKIYISRQNTGRRTIVNEAEVLECLQPHNFEIVCCESMTVAQQARLFSESAVIICSHGSALTNIVFCQPGAIILDIFNPSHLNPCFWYISQYTELNYLFMQGEARPIDNNRKNDNTWVDINEFKRHLNLAGL